MGKDNDDFYGKIRKINQQNALSDNSMNQQTLNERNVPAAPKNFFENLAEFVPGLVLIVWTVVPLSLAIVFADSMITMLCLYPLLSPLIWMAVAKSKPDKVQTTIVMGIIGHVILVIALWYLLQNFSGMGNNIGFDFVGLLAILALLVYSALGSIITMIFFSKVDGVKD